QDWEEKTTEQVVIETESPAVISTKDYLEESTTRGIGGPPGVAANVQDTGIGAETSDTGTTIEETVVNNQYPWLKALTKEEIGEIQQISVAVLIDYFR